MADIPVGRWVRAREYELSTSGLGTYIRPVPGAELEAYDPWAERDGEPQHDDYVGRIGANVAPWASLTRLLDDNPELERARGAMVPTLSPDASGALLGWCRQYGLLGLTLHEVRAVNLPGQLEDEGDRTPTIRRFHWSSGGWMESERAAMHLPTGDRGLFEPRVEYRPLMGHDFLLWSEGPFRIWSSAFPAAEEAPADEYRFPVPGSADFWRDYGEPVGEFLNAAHSLRDVLNAAEEQKRVGRQDARRVAVFFNRLLDRVHPVVRPKAGGGWEQAESAPSLLAILALMARDDLTTSALHRCPEPHGCGRLFRSTAHAVKYCSDRCRSRAAKRERAEAARAEKARGESREGEGV